MPGKNRIGGKMASAAAYVAANPGVTKMAVAAAVGPNGSLRYGYKAVDRAIAAGLITARQSPDGRKYQLFPGDWDMETVCFQ